MDEEIIFEFQTIGDSLRVTAISSSSLVEVTVVAPAATPRSDLLRLATRKLRAAETRGTAPSPDPPPKKGPARGLLI